MLFGFSSVLLPEGCELLLGKTNQLEGIQLDVEGQATSDDLTVTAIAVVVVDVTYTTADDGLSAWNRIGPSQPTVDKAEKDGWSPEHRLYLTKEP